MQLSAKSAFMGAAIDGTRSFLGLPKRYTKEGLILRGNGTLRLDDEHLRFKWTGVDRELAIPLNSVLGADVADRHLGRRPLGSQVLLVKWVHRGLVLVAGFALKEDAEVWRHYIQQTCIGGRSGIT